MTVRQRSAPRAKRPPTPAPSKSLLIATPKVKIRLGQRDERSSSGSCMAIAIVVAKHIWRVLLNFASHLQPRKFNTETHRTGLLPLLLKQNAH